MKNKTNTKGENKMKAQEAIDKIKAERTTFMGRDVMANPYATNVRKRLQQMAENDELSPLEYWESLKLTWPEMSKSERAGEYADLA